MSTQPDPTTQPDEQEETVSTEQAEPQRHTVPDTEQTEAEPEVAPAPEPVEDEPVEEDEPKSPKHGRRRDDES